MQTKRVKPSFLCLLWNLQVNIFLKWICQGWYPYISQWYIWWVSCWDYKLLLFWIHLLVSTKVNQSSTCEFYVCSNSSFLIYQLSRPNYIKCSYYLMRELFQHIQILHMSLVFLQDRCKTQKTTLPHIFQCKERYPQSFWNYILWKPFQGTLLNPTYELMSIFLKILIFEWGYPVCLYTWDWFGRSTHWAICCLVFFPWGNITITDI